MISRRSLIKSGVASLLYSGLAHAGIRGRYRPSLKQGYARNMGESEYPELWLGLVGAWPLGMQGSGNTTYDFSGYGNHGTLINGPTWVGGKYGRALSFGGDASAQRVDASVSTDLFSTNFSEVSVSAWVLVDSANDTNSRIVTYGLDAFNGMSLEVQNADASTQSRFLVETNNVEYNTPYIGVMTDGAWHHVVGRLYNGNTSEVYVDGSLVIQQIGESVSGTWNGGVFNSVFIGYDGNTSGTKFFDGLIDDVRIYDRALSPSEIQLLYEVPYAPFVKRKRIYGISQVAGPSPRRRGVHTY